MWRWFEPWGFMNTERGKHKSQFEALSQRLFGLTFWGDYGGDIVTRYNYTALLRDYPLAVESIEAMHGQALVLAHEAGWDYTAQLHAVIEFLAWHDPRAAGFGEGDFWSPDEFATFEYELAYEEMSTGWWAEYHRGELMDYFADWEDNTIVPEGEEWGELLQTLVYEEGDFYPYWESADSLIVDGWNTERAAEYLLDQYAKSISDAGNPQDMLGSYTGEETK